MRGLLRRFVREEGGFVAGPEWAFVATILVLGAITGVMLTQQHVERQEGVEREQPAVAADVRAN